MWTPVGALTLSELSEHTHMDHVSTVEEPHGTPGWAWNAAPISGLWLLSGKQAPL